MGMYLEESSVFGIIVYIKLYGNAMAVNLQSTGFQPALYQLWMRRPL
jgi:hypothetical protein